MTQNPTAHNQIQPQKVDKESKLADLQKQIDKLVDEREKLKG